VITTSDADGIRALRCATPGVLSVYLPIPVDLADHRGLATRARELVKAAAGRAGSTGNVNEADLAAITQAIQHDSHDWLGHTIAIFACAETGLLVTWPLPRQISERAVISARPYTRPLYAVLQRNPAYHAAIIDTRHAWILAVADDRIDTLAERTGDGVPSPRFSGWYGLEAYRIQQRITHLARQHFKDTIAVLEHTADGQRRPLVIGGHETEVRQFITTLPRPIAQNVAGSFHADLRTLTPARVRELADPVIARWVETSESRLVDDVLSLPHGISVTTDLSGCVAAVRSHAVAQLIIPDEQMVPGFACDDCGAMTADAGGCDCGDQACHPVPDLLDEMASRVLDDAGQVTSVRNAPFPAAARLRFSAGVGAMG